MIHGVWGRKLGMSQRFINDKAVPVTAIEVTNWFVTGLRSQENNGYSAIQVAQVKKRHSGTDFSADWIKNGKKYFSSIKEIRTIGNAESIVIGTPLTPTDMIDLKVGEYVNVTGVTKGAGFQGVVKRHGFTGGRASHGDKTGRKPGAGGVTRGSGNVIKGKRFPGHMGVDNRTMKNLEVIAWQGDVLFIKGSIPGKSHSLVFVNKNVAR